MLVRSGRAFGKFWKYSTSFARDGPNLSLSDLTGYDSGLITIPSQTIQFLVEITAFMTRRADLQSIKSGCLHSEIMERPMREQFLELSFRKECHRCSLELLEAKFEESQEKLASALKERDEWKTKAILLEQRLQSKEDKEEIDLFSMANQQLEEAMKRDQDVKRVVDVTSPSKGEVQNKERENDDGGREKNNREGEEEKKILSKAYGIIKQRTDLFFGVDKELDDILFTTEGKRISTAGVTFAQTPSSVSPGYGEISMNSFTRIISVLKEVGLEMSRESIFLDIGSGYGKCVVHAKVEGAVKRSIGIEYVASRHFKAIDSLKEIKQRIPEEMWDTLEFHSGDATEERFRRQMNEATHIYCYDYIFNPSTHQINQASACQALICFSAPSKLFRFGGKSFRLARRVSINTTGKQHFTAFIYRKRTDEDGDISSEEGEE
ncbi:hypothetical protein PROFUN_03889 [Planoprotostelium fungivorum]|uniref:DOT1 domain-containing protein n=1 Tax=Planoprotostelium fungivorum TaxID=1890364 RepID=A0A2P6MTM3_9EUKA|nr:hypothetical protein PROFUN_03889 [Planoprotostelium fungivorum]